MNITHVIDSKISFSINLQDKRDKIAEGCKLKIFDESFIYKNGDFQKEKPKPKTLSVSGIEYDHNLSQELPEIIGEWFDMNALEIVGYKAGDCTCKTPKLEWRHFIRVHLFNTTKHPKTKEEITTVCAWTENSYKAPVLLICKIK